MIQPENLDAATMEYAASLVERGDLLDAVGVLSEDAAERERALHRMDVRREMRAEMAAFLRAMTGREDLTPLARLRAYAVLPDGRHDAYLTDAWPLALKGWLRIEARIVCTGNSIPAETNFRIELTERGRQALVSDGKASVGDEEADSEYFFGSAGLAALAAGRA